MRNVHGISNQIARRFVLGLQGLWPGRRWNGKEGTAQAVHALEAVQVDPMNVVARSHDLVLWNRVLNYQPEYLDTLLYRDRAFFDYGGCVHIYPMEELPYWLVHMRRRCHDKRSVAFFSEHAAVADAVRDAIRMQGPLGSRDIVGTAMVESYRARKDTGLALYNLWLTGEFMTYRRDGFQRIYDLRERVAPKSVDREVSDEEAERFFARKALALLGLHTVSAWAGSFSYLIHRIVGRAETEMWLERLEGEGILARVEVEGQRAPYICPASATPLLAALAADTIPERWRPLEMTTDEETVFLCPLDNVLDRKRALTLFGFEYLWEIYKPAARRRWGYFTMPILWKDQLVGRLDPKLDRATGALIIKGLWLESPDTSDDPDFIDALARGLDRFARFHGASDLDISAIQPDSLQRSLEMSSLGDCWALHRPNSRRHE